MYIINTEDNFVNFIHLFCVSLVDSNILNNIVFSDEFKENQGYL